MGGLTVRDARADQIEAVRALVDASWLSTYPPLIGEAATRAIIATRHAPDLLACQRAAPGALFLVAEADGAVVGHLHAHPDDNPSAGGGSYIDRLHARPERKGEGIGTALLVAAEARLAPGTRVWLTVLRGNDASLAFYRARGFRPEGETDACGGLAGIPAIVLSRRAGDPFRAVDGAPLQPAAPAPLSPVASGAGSIPAGQSLRG